jgi:rod shape-determining protein MreD
VVEVQPTIWQRLDGTARALSPFAITFLLVVAGVVPIRAPDVAPVMPALALTAVYYWTVFRPDLMPLWAIFLIGLFQDLLTGAPLGVGVLALVLVALAVAAQRRFYALANFVMVWVAYAVIAAFAFAIVWLLSSFVLGQLVDPAPLVLSYLATIATYPCLAWLFGRAQQAFLS